MSDCRTAALVTAGGDVVWWPGARFDGPSVFTRMLDPDAGHFSIRPPGACVSRRAYVDGALALQTDHDTGTGVLRVTDALALAPGARGHEIGHASPDDALVRVVAVLHSARVIQGLTYQPTGAVIAAATTSLPEVPGGSQNWDYRYAWLRDASLIARALLAATCADEAQRFFGWMARAAVSCRESESVQIVFGAAGERLLHESELEHLAGFAGARPVRLGNDAFAQRQHDVLGEVLDVALALGDDLEDELDDFTAAFLCQLADRAAEQWREPDSGIWERRDRERRHTLSAAMCWVALDRGVQLAAALGEHADPQRWARVRDEIREEVLDQGWSDARGAFAGTLGGDEVDASVLLLPIVGFVDAADERMRRTIAAIEATLGAGGLLRRTEDRPDEGAFVPATFWLASCHALAGDVGAARAAFERAAACANDVGLLAEMADPATGEPRGNTPQALSHVGLIHAAEQIARAEAIAMSPQVVGG